MTAFNTEKERNMLPAALWPRAIAISVVLCVSVLWLDADYLGLCAAFLTTGSFALQVLQILKTRETKAISNSMYLAFSCGVLCWLVYGLQIGDIPLIIANAITLALACTVLLLKLKNEYLTIH